MKSAQLGIVKVVSLLGLVIAVSGCASTAPTYNPSSVKKLANPSDESLKKKDNQAYELGRLSMERAGWTSSRKRPWFGYFFQITAESGDELLKRNGIFNKLQKYYTIDLTPGKYRVKSFCEGPPSTRINIKTGGAQSGDRPSSMTTEEIEVVANQETVLMCEPFVPKSKDFLKSIKARLKVLEVKPIEHDKSSKKGKQKK